MRISVEDGDIIEIEPRGGEIMFSIRVQFIDDLPGMPDGAVELVVSPYHMNGGNDGVQTVRARG